MKVSDIASPNEIRTSFLIQGEDGWYKVISKKSDGEDQVVVCPASVRETEPADENVSPPHSTGRGTVYLFGTGDDECYSFEAFIDKFGSYVIRSDSL